MRSLLPAVALLLPVLSLEAQEITWWQGDVDGALAAAKDKRAGLLFLYCWTTDDPACKGLYAETLLHKDFVAASADFVVMGADSSQAAGKAVHERFKISRVPTCLFLKPDGSVEDLLVGDKEIKPFMAEIARIRSGKDTLSDLAVQIGKTPDDPTLKLLLARKLRAAARPAEADKLIEEIITKDPKGLHESAAEAQLEKICAATFRPEVTPQDVDLKALKEFLIKQKNKRILFLGYDRIAAAEWRREDLKAAGEAVDRAFKVIPADEVLDWGNRVAAMSYEFRNKLDKAQQKLVLDIAKKSIAAAEARAKAEPGSEPWLAERLYTFASVQHFNNLRKDAFATMERAIQLDPKNENLRKALEGWKDGAK